MKIISKYFYNILIINKYQIYNIIINIITIKIISYDKLIKISLKLYYVYYYIYIMFNKYNLDENKINTLLEEINNDRTQYFNDIKNDKENDNKIKQRKLVIIDNLLSRLISFKKVINDEKKTLDKD